MEIFKEIKGYEGLYSISNTGKLLINRYSVSCKRNGKPFVFTRKEVITTGSVNKKNGYCNVALRKNGHVKYTSIHRLVCLTFLENPLNYPEVNHINGIKTDNHVSNLEWCTCKDNINHSYKISHSKAIGQTHAMAKLNEKQVLEIRNLLSIKKPQSLIAKKYNVSLYTISDIKRYKTWRHI